MKDGSSQEKSRTWLTEEPWGGVAELREPDWVAAETRDLDGLMPISMGSCGRPWPQVSAHLMPEEVGLWLLPTMREAHPRMGHGESRSRRGLHPPYPPPDPRVDRSLERAAQPTALGRPWTFTKHLLCAQHFTRSHAARQNRSPVLREPRGMGSLAWKGWSREGSSELGGRGLSEQPTTQA